MTMWSEPATFLWWSRRHMRRPGSSVGRNEFVSQKWHIQSPKLGHSGTYCGVNVLRFYSERARASIESPPEGALCAKCLRQFELGRVLPQGGGARSRRRTS